MDDLKVFVGKPKDGKDYELFLDDVIFFDDDPDMPRETEPFPNRVIFLAAFDTGIDPKSKPKYWPGEFEVRDQDEGRAGRLVLGRGPGRAAQGDEGQVDSPGDQAAPARRGAHEAALPLLT